MGRTAPAAGSEGTRKYGSTLSRAVTVTSATSDWTSAFCSGAVPVSMASAIRLQLADDVGARRREGRRVECVGEFVMAEAQVRELFAQLADTHAALLLGHCSLLERTEVPRRRAVAVVPDAGGKSLHRARGAENWQCTAIRKEY